MTGAAYRVVFERVGDPRRCSTDGELAIMGTVVASLREWAKTLEPLEARAYERAATQFLEEARIAAENSTRYRRMISLHATITKPPEDMRVPPPEAPPGFSIGPATTS